MTTSTPPAATPFCRSAAPSCRPMPNAARTTRWSAGSAKRLGARHPGFEMTAFEMIERTLRASGLPGPDDVRGRRLARLLARRSRPGIFSTGSGMPTRNFISGPTGRRSARSTRAAGFPDHRRGDRRRRPGAAVSARAGAVALVPEHELQQHAVEHRPRGQADRARPSRRAGRARGARRRSHPHRQRQAAASSSMPAPSTACRSAS